MNPLRERIDALIAEESDAVRTVAGQAYVEVLALDHSYGIVALGEEEIDWAVVEGDEIYRFMGGEKRFVELLDIPRRDFEEQLEASARAAGLPPEDTLFSFDAPRLVETILATRSQHFCRVGLKWLLPSELRALSPAMRRLAADEDMPRDIRELAEHLAVE